MLRRKKMVRCNMLRCSFFLCSAALPRRVRFTGGRRFRNAAIARRPRVRAVRCPRVPSSPAPAPRPAASPDLALARRILDGDEPAFRRLVDELHATLVRLARGFVPSAAVAEEVAQETWVAVLEGRDRYEGRAGLRTWIARILVNRARTR